MRPLLMLQAYPENGCGGRTGVFYLLCLRGDKPGRIRPTKYAQKGSTPGKNGPVGVGDRETLALSRQPKNNPRQRERRRGLGAGQYSLGKWMTLLVKYRVISSSGKSVCSISFVKTMLPLPSSHVSVAVRSGCTASFQT